LLIAFQPGFDRINGVQGVMRDAVVQHNTIVPSASGQCWAGVYFGVGQAKTPYQHITNNIWVLDNALCRQTYGDGGWQGMAGLNGYMGDPAPIDPRFVGNVMYVPSGDKVQTWPLHDYASPVPMVFANAAAGDYTLVSPNWADTSDGVLAGVDMSKLSRGFIPAPSPAQVAQIEADLAAIAAQTSVVATDSTKVSNDNAAMANDNRAITYDTALVASDNAAVTVDAATVAYDFQHLCSGASSVNCVRSKQLFADQTKLTADKAALANDQAKLAADQAKLAADQATLAADQARLAADQAALAQKQSDYNTYLTTLCIGKDGHTYGVGFNTSTPACVLVK
jgi:hypothetical protein